MANGRRGFFRDIILRLDRDAARQVQEETQEALDRAGKGGAQALEEAMQEGGNKAVRALTRELSRAYDQTIAEARVKFADGIIPASEFARIRAEADATFNRGLIEGIRRLQSEGKLTEQQFVRLSRRLKVVGREGSRDIGQATSAVERLRQVALSATGVIAGLFAVRRLVQFRAEVRRLAEEGAADTQTLIQALGNVGVAWEDVRGEVSATADVLWDTHRMTSQEVEVALRELVSVTGDYALALQHVGLAQDVAAATGSSLEKAAQRVGRVLRGDYAWMRRFGWAAEDAEHALALLQERTGGMARAQISDSEVLAKAWEDLRQEIGAALLDAERGASVYETITRIVRDMTAWISRHRGEISAFLTGTINSLAWIGRQLGALARAVEHTIGAAMHVIAVAVASLAGSILDVFNLVPQAINWIIDQANRIPGVDIDFRIGTIPVDQFFHVAGAAAEGLKDDVRGLGGALADLARGFVSVGHAAEGAGEQTEGATRRTRAAAEAMSLALAEEVRILQRGHRLGVLTAQERARALELERQITRQLQDGTLALEDRIELAQQLQALQEITPQIGPPRMADTMGVLPALAPIPLGPIRDARAEVDALAQRWLEANADMVGAAERAAMGITGAFQDAFSILIQDFGDVGEAAEAMARGVAGALVGGVADYASSKVSENVALAIEATARALAAASNPFTAGLAPGYWAAAKTHALAAAKWAVLAGAAGAGQAAIAGGGRGGLSGGIPTGARDTTGRLLEERRGPEVHIYIDPLDPANPAWQRSVYAAQRYAQQRYGDGATVHVHPRTGGGR